MQMVSLTQIKKSRASRWGSQRHTRSAGFAMVEMLVGSAMLVIISIGVINAYSRYVRISSNNLKTVKAIYIAEEGVEVVKSLRDNSWSNTILKIATSTPFSVSFSTSTSSWSTSTTILPIDGQFYRSISLKDVQRHYTGRDIMPTGSYSYDPNTKLVVVDVSWLTPIGTTTKTLNAYITNLFGN